MDDKNIMEGLLVSSKSIIDLYMHGSVESSTPNVHDAFNTALNETLCMQNDIYKQMEQRGWYATSQAQPQQLQQVKQKFCC